MKANKRPDAASPRTEGDDQNGGHSGALKRAMRWYRSRREVSPRYSPRTVRLYHELQRGETDLT